jgi:hypothetical protein
MLNIMSFLIELLLKFREVLNIRTWLGSIIYVYITNELQLRIIV